jgi:hypothetical protein
MAKVVMPRSRSIRVPCQSGAFAFLAVCALFLMPGRLRVVVPVVKSNPNILVVQAAQDRAAKNGPG